MANAKRGRKKLVKKLVQNAIIIVVLIILSLVSSIFFPEEDNSGTTGTNPQQQTTTQNPKPSNGSTSGEEDVLIMAMVDVGQADAFVFEQGGMVAVIDCGEDSTGESLINYLDQRGITRIDFLCGSHPHDDHIGGMSAILDKYEIDTVLLPEVEGFDSDCYADLEDQLYEGDYNVEFIKEGNVYHLGDATITVLEQQEGLLDEPNNYSAILKVSYGDMDVIMTGDAETAVEKAVLQSGVDVSAEILKVGHHGSNTSSSNNFLDAVNPTYALISCEVGNQHKHPTEKIMERLETRDIEVYRTDECGTVILTITTTDVIFNCEPGDYLSGTELKEKMGVD